MDHADRILSLVLDEGRVLKRKPEIEQERQAAIDDLLHENRFHLPELAGPYHLTLAIRENRILFDVRAEAMIAPATVSLPVAALRGVVKDYFLICENYFAAATGDPYKLEAIDMARRGIHNEGSDMLRKMLEGKIAMDFATARRLFTLVCVLHIR